MGGKQCSIGINILARTYAPPVNRKIESTDAHGVTTVLFQCEGCTELRTEEMLGAPVKNKDSYLAGKDFCSCGAKEKEPHYCPYEVELGNPEFKCNCCCDKCRKRCLMEV